MRKVKPNDNSGMWDVKEGRLLLASFESESLAKEFAAAPDLLEAAQQMLTHMQLIGSGQQPLMSNAEACELLGTAIAKATG